MDTRFEMVKTGKTNPALSSEAIEHVKQNSLAYANVCYLAHKLYEHDGDRNEFDRSCQQASQLTSRNMQQYAMTNDLVDFQISDMTALSVKIFEEETERLKRGGQLRDIVWP